MKFESTVKDKTYSLEFNETLSNVEVNGTKHDIKFLQISNGRHLLRLGRKTYLIDNISKTGSKIDFTLNSKWFDVNVKDEQAILLDKMGFQGALSGGGDNLIAPMPGKILNVMVTVGDQVKQCDPLIILEAMKMENELKAPIDGTISAIQVETGKSVDKKAILIEIKAIG
ncbi:MAG: acetyl-CoA carboxylase biotin carboxyl carrier protein subunit [Balneolales bacterium]